MSEVPDCTISFDDARKLAEVTEDCGVSCVILNAIAHAEGHRHAELSIDAELACLVLAIRTLAATQPDAWRKGALESCQRMLSDDHPANQEGAPN